MTLYRQRRGQGPPLLLLHGLFGSGNNWGALAPKLEGDFTLYIPDLRNHGRSGHSEEASLDAMADDLDDLLEGEGLQSISLLGHSLGARVAMRWALREPARCEALFLEDMSPGAYGPLYPEIFAALQDFPLESVESRVEADFWLKPRIPDEALRAFLLTNLSRQGEGFVWKMNWRALEKAAPGWQLSLESEQPYVGPAQFLFGEKSNYLREADRALIQKNFPQSNVKILEGAGHWLHVDQPEAFLEAVRGFFLKA